MKKLFPIFAWIIGTFAVIMQFVTQLSSGMIINELIYSFHLNGVNAGLLAGAYYPVYCILQVPAGLFVNRVGAQQALIWGLLFAGWATLCFAFAEQFNTAVIGRFLSGVGLSCCFVSLIYIINNFFSRDKFGLMLGLSEALILLGVMIVEYFIPNKVTTLGWRLINKILALSLVLLGVIITFWMPKIKTKKIVHSSFIKSIFSLKPYIKDLVIWGNSLYAGAMFAVITVFEGLWSHPFFEKTWNFSINQTSLCNNFLLFGVMLGAPIAGLIASKKYRYNTMFFIAIFLIFLFFIMLSYGNSMSSKLLYFILFLIGLIASSYVISNSIASARATQNAKTAIVGWNNMLVVILSPIVQIFVGWLLDVFNKYGEGLKYQYALYGFLFLLIILFCASAALIVLGYKTQKPINYRARICDI